MEDGKRDISEFNSAVSYLNRLNMLFSMCAESAINLDPYMWFHSLLALYRELSTEMKLDEIDKFESNKDIINSHVTEWMNLTQIRGQEPIPNKLYEELHNFEMNLRKIMKDAGLQQKMMEDAMKALK